MSENASQACELEFDLSIIDQIFREESIVNFTNLRDNSFQIWNMIDQTNVLDKLLELDNKSIEEKFLFYKKFLKRAGV